MPPRLAQIELPPQLLQPVIENAVRHGAAHLKSEGRIELRVVRDGDDLIIWVCNNSLPNAQRVAGQGRGIQFTRQQLEKLQQLYKHRRISLDLQVESSGAKACFYFQHWLNTEEP